MHFFSSEIDWTGIFGHFIVYSFLSTKCQFSFIWFILFMHFWLGVQKNFGLPCKHIWKNQSQPEKGLFQMFFLCRKIRTQLPFCMSSFLYQSDNYFKGKRLSARSPKPLCVFCVLGTTEFLCQQSLPQLSTLQVPYVSTFSTKLQRFIVPRILFNSWTLLVIACRSTWDSKT